MITMTTIIILELTMRATAMVVMQDLVTTILIEMVPVMLLIVTGMMEMIMMITITIAIKSGEVSDNSMPTICMTPNAFQSMWTKPNDFRFHSCDLLQQLHNPPPLQGVPTKSIEGRSSRKEAAIHQGSI